MDNVDLKAQKADHTRLSCSGMANYVNNSLILLIKQGFL